MLLLKIVLISLSKIFDFNLLLMSGILGERLTDRKLVGLGFCPGPSPSRASVPVHPLYWWTGITK